MPAVKLAVTRSECRCGCHEIGSRRAPCFDANAPTEAACVPMAK